MAQYQSQVAENPKVEMIQISLDRDKRSAEGWAVRAQLPWYTVLPDEIQSSGFIKYKTTRYVPEYALLNAKGERLATGNEDVFGKIAELTR